MTYSSALWPDNLGGVRGDLEGRSSDADLEKAQQYKIAHLLRKARVRPGDRVLEFGSGWGALAIAAGKLGCEVDTITLSPKQKAFAEARIAEEGLDGKIRVHLCDYRNLPPEFERAFDAFISVEMVEVCGMRVGSGELMLNRNMSGCRLQIPPAFLRDHRLGIEARSRRCRDYRNDTARESLYSASVSLMPL